VVATPVVDGKVKVHIHTKELVTLEHRPNPSAPWQHGCETPCDERFPAGDEFRIVGVGIATSNPFSLTTPKGDVVKLYVAPGVKSKAKVGEFLTFTGATLIVGALVVGLAAADPSSVFNANGTTDNYNYNVIAVATTVAVAGIITGVLGGAWWYDNSRTRVAGDAQEQEPEKRPPNPDSDYVARRAVEPEAPTGMRAATPVRESYSAPLFVTHF
jgi:hypothetical protein